MRLDSMFTNMMGTIVLVYVIIGFVVPFMLIYVLGFVRRQQDGQSDDKLGAKVFLTLLMSVSFQIIVFGFYRFIAVAMNDAPNDSQSFLPGSGNHGPYDLALGLLYGGGIAAIYPTLIYALVRFRQKVSDPIFRAALGVNSIFTGLVFVVGVTFLMVTMMTTDNNPTEPISITFAYLMASLICGVPLALAAPIKPRVQAESSADA